MQAHTVERGSFIPVSSTRTGLPFPHISGRLDTVFSIRVFLSEQQETVIIGLFVFKRTIKTHWIKSASSTWQLWKFFSLWRSLCSKCFCCLSAGEGAASPKEQAVGDQPSLGLRGRAGGYQPPLTLAEPLLETQAGLGGASHNNADSRT